MLSYCVFNLHFPKTARLESFQKFIGHVCFLFYEVLVHVSCSFFFWIIIFLLIYCWNYTYYHYISIYDPLIGCMCCKYLFPSADLSFRSLSFSVVSLCSESWGYFPILSSKTFIVFPLSHLFCVFHVQDSRSPILFLCMWISSFPSNISHWKDRLFSCCSAALSEMTMYVWICISACYFILLFYILALKPFSFQGFIF